MRITKTTSVIAIVAVVMPLGLTSLVRAAATFVDLGTAGDFAVLAGAAITDSSPPTGLITGDVGLSPTGGASITGLTCAQVTGTIYDTNGGYTGNPAGTGCLTTDAGLLTTAKTNLSAAYNDANGQTPDTLVDDGALGGGETLTPGVYSEDNTPDSLAISGELILDGGGNPDAVFIFQSDSTLITASNTTITLTNGTQACNVFWQVGSSATLGTGTQFAGTIMAAVSITDNGGSTIAGRLLADANNLDADSTGAVTLNDTNVAVPDCASAATLNVIKIVSGGAAASADFTVHVTDSVDAEVAGSPQAGASAPGTTYSLAAGTFEVNEDADATYTRSFSGDCDASGSITVALDGDYTCTLTNTFIEEDSSGGGGGSSNRRTPTLRVIKVVEGGTATPSDFTVFVREDGDNVSDSPQAGSSAPGTRYRLSSGTYVVSETASSTYTRRFSGDCDANGSVTLSGDDDETCTITNTYVSAATTPVPGLPNTGLPPGGNTARNLALCAAALIALASLGVVIKKRAV